MMLWQSFVNILLGQLLVFALLLFNIPAAGAADKQNGVNYHPTWRGAMTVYSGTAYDRAAYENMKSMGINWIALNVTAYQQTLASTVIELDMKRKKKDGSEFFLTPADEEIAFAVDRAHQDGLKIMLKPCVTAKTFFRNPDDWHGLIGSRFTTEAQWNAWFASYTAFLVHYASLSAKLGVDQLCIGTELKATAQRTRQWRAVVAAIREVYNGPLTYAAHHTRAGQIGWWDAVDYIGIDAYYPLTAKNDPTVAELRAGWRPYLRELANLATKFNKPILFTELGYTATDGAGREPWAFRPAKKTDLAEQADLYQAFFEEAYGKPWLRGVFWWVWYPGLATRELEKNFQPYGKPAGKVLKRWYGATR